MRGHRRPWKIPEHLGRTLQVEIRMLDFGFKIEKRASMEQSFSPNLAKCCYWGDWMRRHLELVTKVEEEMWSCHHNPKFWPPRPWFLIGHGDSSQWSSSSSQLGGLSVRHGKGIMEHLYVMGSIDRDCWSWLSLNDVCVRLSVGNGWRWWCNRFGALESTNLFTSAVHFRSLACS